jgi:uncharacterized protein
MAKGQSNGRFWAMLCHFSTWLGFLLPGFSLIAPLIVWGLKRDQDPLIADNGRNVINFILSFWLYSLGLFFIFGFIFLLLMIPFINIMAALGFVFWGCCAVIYGIIYFAVQIIFPLYGGMKAFNGEVYRYPLTVSFLKETLPNPKPRKSSAK